MREFDGWPDEATWDAATVLANERVFFDYFVSFLRANPAKDFTIRPEWLKERAKQFKSSMRDWDNVKWELIALNLEYENDRGWVKCDVCGADYQRAAPCPHRSKQRVLILDGG